MTIEFCFRNTFTGTYTLYGSGNNDLLNSVKAGPGTLYTVTGKSPKLVHSLTIVGNVDNSVQNQTYTYISGQTVQDFTYNLLTLSGMCERSSLNCQGGTRL
jgi:hypothetical protein